MARQVNPTRAEYEAGLYAIYMGLSAVIADADNGMSIAARIAAHDLRTIPEALLIRAGVLPGPPLLPPE